MNAISKLMPALLIVLLMTSGCSSNSKFFKSKSQNLAPFATQTIDMIGSLDYGLEDEQMVYLRDVTNYIDEEEPFKRYKALETQALTMLKATIVYSMQIVAISEQDISGAEKSKALADVIVSLEEPMNETTVIEPTMTPEQVEEILQEVRSSDKFLDALRAAQPLINDFSGHAGRVLDELRAELRVVNGKIEGGIDRKFGEALAAEKELRLIRNDYYSFIVNLSQYGETGNADYLAKMKQGPLELRPLLQGKKRLSSSDIVTVHKAWTERMTTLNANYEQLLPDIKELHSTHVELDAIATHKSEAISQARQMFIIWARAYGKMASGKIDPAEWFDITETGGMLFGAAKGAVL